MIEPEDLGDPWATWLHDHQPTAMVQGWGLWDSSNRTRLQRVDDPEEGMAELTNDSAAWDHVLFHAHYDKTCRAALEFLALHEPEELIDWTKYRPLPDDEGVQALIVTAHLRYVERA